MSPPPASARGAHAHDHAAEGASDRRVLATVVANVLLTVAQIVGGALSGSVALVADALHNLNDALALVVVLVARRVARRSADRRRTFGYRRARVVGALVNLVALGVVALFLAYESVLRLIEPRAVDGPVVIALAAVALVVDVATVLLLVGMRRGDVNLRAAFVHNLADALASAAVLMGGVAITATGWSWLDPLLSLLIVAYVAVQVVRMLPGVIRILMESAPEGLELDAVVHAIRGVDGVRDAHHLHAWLLDEHRCALEAHVVVDPARLDRMEAIKNAVRRRLVDEFGIVHATLELEVPEVARRADHDTRVVAGEGHAEGSNGA